jgi:hypothetical protein
MKTTYKLTYQQRREIVTMYEEGHKLAYIAALYGVAREYPSHLALRWGSKHRKPSMRRNWQPRNVVKGRLTT